MYDPPPSIGFVENSMEGVRMYKVELYVGVRRACMVDGMSSREAARVFGLHRDTVRKMLEHSVPPGYRRQSPPRRPKLDPYRGVIDRILEEDRSLPKKQRHTAKRIYERLRAEHSFIAAQVVHFCSATCPKITPPLTQKSTVLMGRRFGCDRSRIGTAHIATPHPRRPLEASLPCRRERRRPAALCARPLRQSGSYRCAMPSRGRSRRRGAPRTPPMSALRLLRASPAAPDSPSGRAPGKSPPVRLRESIVLLPTSLDHYEALIQKLAKTRYSWAVDSDTTAKGRAG